MTTLEPTPEPLSSPRATPFTDLGWVDVQTRVAEAGDYLVATTDPDGRPHVVEPAQVFAFGKEDGFTATCWRFTRGDGR
ncbi:hypothetical protein [Kribbella sp. NPDC023855]|uniref:hypothetical protein n=1 Tax=Kribbella sp. NPDC023855 TaxID=3154698 RepID=UPI0033F00D07